MKVDRKVRKNGGEKKKDKRKQGVKTREEKEKGYADIKERAGKGEGYERGSTGKEMMRKRDGRNESRDHKERTGRKSSKRGSRGEDD